jgi:GNAT superfamily N-acetyltransferase
LLELKKYTSKNVSYRLGIDILSRVELSTHVDQAGRERNFVEDICKRVQKSSTVLYLLKHDNNTLGFVSLSVSSIGDFPSLQIDYLFVNHAFRGKTLEVLDNLKTSTYLIEFAIELAKEIQELAGLRYLVLLPDNDKLQDIYKNIGFLHLPKQDWLYIKL